MAKLKTRYDVSTTDGMRREIKRYFVSQRKIDSMTDDQVQDVWNYINEYGNITNNALIMLTGSGGNPESTRDDVLSPVTSEEPDIIQDNINDTKTNEPYSGDYYGTDIYGFSEPEEELPLYEQVLQWGMATKGLSLQTDPDTGEQYWVDAVGDLVSYEDLWNDYFEVGPGATGEGDVTTEPINISDFAQYGYPQEFLDFYSSIDATPTMAELGYAYSQWQQFQPATATTYPYQTGTDMNTWGINKYGEENWSQLTPGERISLWENQPTSYTLPEQGVNTAYDWARTVYPEEYLATADPSSILAAYNSEMDRQRNIEYEDWARQWEMAQAPATAQPTRFAGWGQQYTWSPTAYMENPEAGWQVTPQAYGSTAYGSDIWAQQAANFWDVANINRILQSEYEAGGGTGTAPEVQYQSFAPELLAQSFTGIEPYQYGYQLSPTKTYQLESMPTWSEISRLSSDELAKLQSGWEGLQTNVDWSEALKQAYEQRPLSGRGTQVYYR